MTLQVRFARLPTNADLPLPVRATPHAAGYDIRSAEESVTLQPGEIRLVGTGLVMELPDGVECQVRPRSGLALKRGITLPNSPGTIDPDYRGEVRVILQNLGSEAVTSMMVRRPTPSTPPRRKLRVLRITASAPRSRFTAASASAIV